MRAIAYIRVSSDEQASEGYSLAAQTTRIRQYTSLYGIDLAELITDDVTAKDLNRPGVRRALAALEKPDIGGLVVAKLDRLTRSVADWERLIARYFEERGGKQLFSVGEQIDTRTAGGRLVLRMLVTVAQWEREVISERTREGLAQKKRQGEHVGVVPYGYRLDAPGGKLEPDAYEQAVIRRVHELHREGRSLRGIAAVLDGAGEPTRRGRRWSAKQVSRLIERELEED